MQAFLLKLILAVLSDPKIKAEVIKLVGPLIPIAVGAAVKAGMDELSERVPGFDGVVDVVKATNAARHDLNNLIPDIDFGIPALDNLLDIWRPRG